MLIASKTRYVPTAVNMIVLQGDDSMYYYMHRSLYDQCVVLDDLYYSRQEALYRQLGVEPDNIPEICSKYLGILPRPVAILAPFLVLVNGREALDTIEDVCGAISSMSMSLDFRRLFKVPAEVRASIKFSLSVREEYKVQWDRFFQETPTLDQVSFSSAASHVAAAADAPITVTSEDDDDDFDPDAIMAAMRERDAAIMGGSYSAPVAEQEEDEPEEEEEKPVSGFSILKGMV